MSRKISVKLHPRSKKPRIEVQDHVLDVYVNEPAIENKANAAAIKAIATFLKIPKSKIRIVSGLKFKIKVFEILD